MRSSEARARNGLAESGRRGSKALKLRISKPPLPPSTGQAPAHASVLYSSQLWQAAGQLQQRLTCDRDLYFPEFAVTGPVVKQVPEEGPAEVQHGKRAKLAGGQYRRGSFREAAASDGTPPGTPYRSSRSAAAEERVNRNVMTSSSSSQDLSQLHHRQIVASSAAECEQAWPLVVPCKRRRSSRLRRSQWQQWQWVLHGLDAPVSADSAERSADAAHQLSSGLQGGSDAGNVLLQQQQQLLGVCTEPQPQPPTVRVVQAAGGDLYQQRDSVPDVQQQDQARGFSSSLQSVAFQMQPPAPKAAVAAEQSLSGKLVLKQPAGDASPGHETSQASEMTCMQESPHAVAVVLSSWPSSSTDSDCQAQPPECAALHKLGCAGVKASVMTEAQAAVGSSLTGQVFSPESPSSPFQGAVC